MNHAQKQRFIAQQAERVADSGPAKVWARIQYDKYKDTITESGQGVDAKWNHWYRTVKRPELGLPVRVPAWRIVCWHCEQRACSADGRCCEYCYAKRMDDWDGGHRMARLQDRRLKYRPVEERRAA